MQNVGSMPGLSFRQRILLQGYRPVRSAINSTSSEFVRLPPERRKCGWKAKLVQGPPFRNLAAEERLATTISDFQEVLELIDKYDWDFDTFLEDDVPAAVPYL